MTYQDIWLKGRCIDKGERECEGRYQIIREFCAQYRRPFTVLDFGASQCYFGVRLTEDFPDCTVLSVERDHADECIDILTRNESRRVILLKRQFSLDDLRALAECEHFDLTLCLSVIHRFGEPWKERMAAFRALGDHLIIEQPDEPNTGGNIEHRIPLDALQIGEGESHLQPDHKRKVLLFSAMKASISKAYLGSPRDDLSLAIYSSFDRKRVHFYNKSEARDWARGINLHTYLEMGGVYPDRERIAAMIEAQRDAVLAAGHGDINPWNVILQGDRCQFIDVHGPMTVDYPDTEYFDKLVTQLRAEVAA